MRSDDFSYAVSHVQLTDSVQLAALARGICDLSGCVSFVEPSAIIGEYRFVAVDLTTSRVVVRLN